jgi:hypothetical protein
MEVDLGKIINVTLLSTPVGMSDFNVNTLGLLTSEAPAEAFEDGYKVYSSPDGVAADFGTDSETYAQAVAIFSQAPNILSGNGYLVIVPLETIADPTSGTMTTGAPGDVAKFKPITTGAFKVSVDGASHEISGSGGLDFSSCEDMDDVALVINAGLTGSTCVYDANANGNLGGFLFTSASTGASSAISKLTAPTSEGLVDIGGASYINGAGNVMIIDGQAGSTTENPIAAIQRTKQDVFYFGVLCAATLSVTTALNLAGYMQTQDKLLFIGRNSSSDIDDIFKPIQEGTLTHTRGFYYTIGAEEARVAVAAYASRLMGINFNGSLTMCTMNLKTLAGVTPDPDAASDNVLLDAETYGFDVYVSIAGTSACLSYGANDYSDQIYAQLWLKLALQVAGFNYLATTNTKIPQTEPGMTGLKGSYAAVCRQGLANGYLASGLTWTSPTTFGNPDDLRRNITDTGYYIYSQPIATQSPTLRAARKAPLIQIAVKEAGAIHHSDVIVQVN